MLPFAPWYAALMGPPRVDAVAPGHRGRGRASVSWLLGRGLIRLGRALSRRGASHDSRLAHVTLAR